MQCTLCGYMLSAFDKTCPRCEKQPERTSTQAMYSPPANEVIPTVSKSKTPVSVAVMLVTTFICAACIYFALFPKQKPQTDNSQKQIAIQPTKTPEHSDRPLYVKRMTHQIAPPTFSNNNNALERVQRQKADQAEWEKQAQVENEMRLRQQQEFAQNQQKAIRRQQAVNQKQMEQAEVQQQKDLYLQQELPKLAYAIDQYNKLLRSSADKRQRFSQSGNLINFANGSKSNSPKIDNGGLDAKNSLILYRDIKAHPLFRTHCIEGQRAFRYLPDADLDFLDNPRGNPEVFEVAELRYIKMRE